MSIHWSIILLDLIISFHLFYWIDLNLMNLISIQFNNFNNNDFHKIKSHMLRILLMLSEIIKGFSLENNKCQLFQSKVSVRPFKIPYRSKQNSLNISLSNAKNTICTFVWLSRIWIDGITEEFFRIFSTKENLKIKVNAMYAIQYFVELAEYPIMTLFEVYILPIIS